MKSKIAVFLIIGTAALAASYATLRASQDAGKTTWDSVYSTAQAQRGETLFGDKCAKCHGSDGTGGDAPVLVGGDFASDWDGLTMAQLFDRTRQSMPQDNPSSLSREQTADLLAFLLMKNSFPAGSADLPTGAEYLAQIKYVAVKP